MSTREAAKTSFLRFMQLLKVLSKRNAVMVGMGISLVINIILVAYNYSILKKRKSQYQRFVQESSSFDIVQPNRRIPTEFYNVPCPETAKQSTKGEHISLRNYAGNVILLRFSRFFRQDLPNLIYLQHLADKYRNQGISLFFINSLGKHDESAINRLVTLRYPIIEDDGSVAAQFNALPEETIIIDRDFTIKFKYHLASKRVIYNEVIKYVFGKTGDSIPPGGDVLLRIIPSLSYFDIFNKTKAKFGVLKNKNLCLTIFTSTCTGCQEDFRISQLKELSKRIDPKRANIFLLFGKGNTEKAIEEYAVSNEWNRFPITVGIIENIDGLPEEDYYKVFTLDTDPRTFIINAKGNLIFEETRSTSKLISTDFLGSLIIRRPT